MITREPEIGRVLRSATAGFAVGCRVSQLSGPGFGSLVKAQPLDERETIYGLIYDIAIDDDQLIRRLVMVEDPPAAVIEDQRTNRLLPIEMNVLSIGYRLGEKVHFGLPLRPPLNLDPVCLVLDPDEVRAVTDDPGYLRLVLGMRGNVPVDQLLVAHIRSVTGLRSDDHEWAVKAVRELIEQLRSNYDVLIPTLQALSDALPELPLETLS